MDYADGDLDASRIEAKRIFQPISAVPETNGDFAFTQKSTQVILHHIDENSTAPPTISATYIFKGGKVSLRFKQISRK